LEFVLRHAKLTDEQRTALQQRFPISTLDRILSTPDARSKIGLDVKAGKLLTLVPAEETIKGLRRIILDLAEKRMNVTKLKLKGQQVDYINSLDAVDKPDLTKATGVTRPVEEIGEKDFPPIPPQPSKKPQRKLLLRGELLYLKQRNSTSTLLK
jgi:hypothetical protein